MQLMCPLLVAAGLCLVMVLPYLPGRFDASAAPLSFMVQVGGYASLLLVPVGLAWLASRRWSSALRTLAVVVGGVVAFATVVAGAAANHTTVGVLTGIAAIGLLRMTYRRSGADEAHAGRRRGRVLLYLVCIPLVLVTFRTAVLPRMADWSRDRAIRHSAGLVAEIEAFRQRRGHYPVSLHSLNSDVATGVIGIERFHYEPNGDAYNLFFVRPHIELDAMEVVLFNPRDEHRFTSHELDLLQYDGEQLDRRRGDRRRTPLARPHWISILFD
jgi:hypothetical protein